MYKSLFALVVFSAAVTPASAQTAPPAQAPAAAKPQTVKKIVCQRVDDEETTGSRLGSAPKVCKTIEVPAASGGGTNSSQTPSAPSSERG